MASTMEVYTGNSWYECFGRASWHQVWRVLTALEKVIHKSYDHIYSTYSIANIGDWSSLHAELMQHVKPTMLVTITKVEVLLRVCFHCAFRR